MTLTTVVLRLFCRIAGGCQHEQGRRQAFTSAVRMMGERKLAGNGDNAAAAVRIRTIGSVERASPIGQSGERGYKTRWGREGPVAITAGHSVAAAAAAAAVVGPCRWKVLPAVLAVAHAHGQGRREHRRIAVQNRRRHGTVEPGRQQRW